MDLTAYRAEATVPVAMQALSSNNKNLAPKVNLLSTYRQRLSQGWQADAAQARAVTRLQALANALGTSMEKPPRGLWLYGPPGRGKSQLLDMFMQALPIPARRRVHFHAFMAEIHRRMNALPPASGKADPVARIAADIGAEATVLGFDEFYLTNLPDAMFLGRLMQALFRQGTVVVATSNWPLPELFQGGLNRERFLPLLRLLQTHMEPVNLTEGLDFRLLGRDAPAQGGHYVLTGTGQSDDIQLDALYRQFSSGRADTPLPFLHARRQSGTVLWATFNELCDKPLGRQEYQQLAAHAQTVIIQGIPQLTPAEADSALRLATLVDILYEQKRRLIVSAAVPPARICPQGPAAQVFQRTASRLVEMTTPSR